MLRINSQHQQFLSFPDLKVGVQLESQLIKGLPKQCDRGF